MLAHWQEEPPVSASAYLIAQMLGYKPPPTAKEQRAFEAMADRLLAGE